jgi:redox-sensitive bicupin YhaK (pirin superfamily)
LWINLPQRLKRVDPTYQQADSEHIPAQTLANGVTSHSIVAPAGPIKLLTEVDYRAIEMAPGSTISLKPGPGCNGLIYVVSGAVTIGENSLSTGFAWLFTQSPDFEVRAIKASRFMFAAGRPWNEPIQQRGTFVD